MADVAPLKATFFAFQKREPGGVLLKATLAYSLVMIALMAAFFALNWTALGPVASWYLSLTQITPGDMPPAPPAGLGTLAPSYFLVMVATFILLAAYEAACLRWLVRGETEGMFGLSLGADTWRVWSGYWVWMLLLIASYVAAILVVIVVGIIIGLLFSQGGAQGGEPLAALMVILSIVVAYSGMAYVATRYAPAAATSIALRKFSFFKAWDVSRKRFWALFGSFLLLGIILFFVFAILYAAATVAVLGPALSEMAASGGARTVLPEVLMTAMASPTGIATIVGFYVVLVAAHMVLYVAFYGINARAALAALEEGKIGEEPLMPPSSAGL